ncbi:MAG: hypothetical protein HY286_05790 [Planctomycetes bacterium]|nr:hypothetical protein [Planctomycetota bacterium]
MTVELYLSQAGDLRPHFTIPAVARSAGHPDSIARALARVAEEAIEEELQRQGMRGEAFSLRPSILLPGVATPRFGGGRVSFPMRMLLVGTGPRIAELRKNELEEMARSACSQWVRGHLRFVDPERDLALEMFTRAPGGVRSAFLSIARAPLAASQYLASEVVALTTSDEFRRLFPEVGDEVECSTLACGVKLRVTVTMAFVDKNVHSERAYFSRKREVEAFLYEKLRALPMEFDVIEICINGGDQERADESGILLTCLGTTADGRRPGRADSAPEGETTSHHAEQFAKAILSRVRGVRAAVVRLEEDDHGQIARAFVRLELLEGAMLEAVRGAIHELVPLESHPARSADPEF